ncbi:MAG TPA: hypothetical protein VFQ26_03230 [Nitrospiraceae bacterium]|nr:hypothetical protein [Nitrospiraceae bacterium]
MKIQERREIAREFGVHNATVAAIHTYMAGKLTEVEGPTQLAEMAMDEFVDFRDLEGELVEDELFFEIAGHFEYAGLE